MCCYKFVEILPIGFKLGFALKIKTHAVHLVVAEKLLEKLNIEL